MRIKARDGGFAPLRAAMANLTLLLLACALASPLHAASIPDAESDLHSKIPAALPEDNKELSQADSVHELVDESAPVKPDESIPVEVVVENVEPSVKLNEVADDDEIVRPQPDLRNPGLPQRQEHETQNPEQHSDEQLRASTIKENIEETQKLLKQSFQDVTTGIQNWISNGDGQSKIQQNIKNLRETFTNQIQKLNDTIQGLAKPEDSKPVELQAAESQRDFKQIESRLKNIKDNFNNGVQTLSAGIDIVASLRSAGINEEEVREEQPAAAVDAPAPAANPAPNAQPAPAAQPPIPPQNFFENIIGVIANRTREGLASVQNMILPNSNQNTQNPPGNVQADTSGGSSGRPPWLPDFSNLPNLGQLFGQGGQIVQNNPFTGFFNIFTNPFAQASTTVKPTSTSPAAEVKPTESKPEAEPSKPAEAASSPPAAQASPSEPVGPIRQFLNNNPITQGLVTTVQRIQGSITSSDTPRVPTEKSELQKGGWHGRPGNTNASGDNNDSSGLSEQKLEEVKEPIQEEPKKEAEDIVEEKPLVVPEKTEEVVV